MIVRSILLVQLFCINCTGQTQSSDTSKFEFLISSTDNSKFFYTVTYHVTEKGIIVTNDDKLYSKKKNEKQRVLFNSRLNDVEKNNLYKIAKSLKADSINSFYYNPCILDGMLLEFRFKWIDQLKRTTLSNYYLDKFQPFVAFVNSKLPGRYKIWYDKKKLEDDIKNCSRVKP